MTIDEIQSMLEGRGKRYSSEEVARSMNAYGEIVPRWYAELWTNAAIFDADMYVYEEDLDDELWAKVSVLRLDGPDDGWKKEQVELTEAGYFSLGSWQGYAYWLIAPSRSTDLEAPIHIIDHELVGEVDEIHEIEGIETFRGLLDSVVNWPILRAIDKWREVMECEQPTPDPTASLDEGGGAETVAEFWEKIPEDRQIKAAEDYSFGVVMGALAGEYPEPVELDEDYAELPEYMQAALRLDLRNKMQRWEEADIGPLPHYESEELPDALQYSWEHLEGRPLGPWRLQRGGDLLRSHSAALERGIPHNFFVIGRKGQQFVTLDLTRPGEFGDCPVVTWPDGQELAPSLGDWLLAQTA